MTFVYLFNAMQIANAAWMSFLVEGLGFKAWEVSGSESRSEELLYLYRH